MASSTLAISTGNILTSLTASGTRSSFQSAERASSYLTQNKKDSSLSAFISSKKPYFHTLSAPPPSTFLSRFVVRASTNETETGEQYDIVLYEKPYGLKFYKGKDGRVYVDAINPGTAAAQTKKVTEGDRVIATSAVFGDEIWPAAEFGRFMYCVRQRVGPLTIQLEKKNGVKIEKYTDRDEFMKERNAGNYGLSTKEKQALNYSKKVELENQRQAEMDQGLDFYKEGRYEEALVSFETVLGLQPEYKELGVASYNAACCYSRLGKLDASLTSLEVAFNNGFEDYQKVRSSPDLVNVRNTDEFDDLLNKYDESFINENAFKAISGVFGFFGKK